MTENDHLLQFYTYPKKPSVIWFKEPCKGFRLRKPFLALKNFYMVFKYKTLRLRTLLWLFRETYHGFKETYLGFGKT